ncbi:hypothetical protein ACS0TY_028795 [Phlomoides rotata]
MANKTSFDSDLFCNEETRSFAFDGDDGEKQGIDSVAFPCFSDECIAFMVERESVHLPRDDYLHRLRTGELDVQLRKEALDWIFKACAHFSFGELCLYTAISYFDRFFSIYDLFPSSSFENGGRSWQIQLVATACLALSAKMEEVEVPSIFDLQEGVPKFMFEGKTVQRMELLVLKGLKWKIKAYTPCSFIDYYLRKLNVENKFPSGNAITRSLQIILSTFEGIEFLEFKPSEIAAAVAMYVSREMEAMDIDKALSCLIGGSVEKEKVVKCMDMIQESSPIDMTITTTTTSTSTRAISYPSSPNGVLEAACLSYKRDEACSSSSQNKRRKLDQAPPLGGGDSSTHDNLSKSP